MLEIISIRQLNRGQSVADRPEEEREEERERKGSVYKGVYATSKPAGISPRDVNLSVTRVAAESN